MNTITFTQLDKKNLLSTTDPKRVAIIQTPSLIESISNSASLFPKAILHIDGDSFFASVEQAQNKNLRGKPIVTGAERGIATSISIEAKRLGITRAMPVWEIKKKFPEVIVVPGDYETYTIYSKRMYSIVRRYTSVVEEYSIDECFADITGLQRFHRLTYKGIAERISNDLYKELGVSFSVGLGPTKVIAKLGSGWKKPHGMTVISKADIEKYLKLTPVRKIWNIGKKTTERLNKMHIQNAIEIARMQKTTVEKVFYKPMQEMWMELNGESVWEVNVTKEKHKSISTTKTFTPPSQDKAFLFSQLSKNIEEAVSRARKEDLLINSIAIFLKTQDFGYHTVEVKLRDSTNNPIDIIREAATNFTKIYKPHTDYRATGVWLTKLETKKVEQLDLFGNICRKIGLQNLYKNLDLVTQKFGKNTVFLGSSFNAVTDPRHVGGKEKVPERRGVILFGESAKRRVAVPYLGMAWCN
ncbi:MAG: polymerase protein [Candidatus Nomurabacteria bacterium]|nr:polymerase protein [Candidatus Nomurabacteria bacterium]